jgi:NAD(P)-dependent dehydrogenase (short-subunit alcohol dehydrogenase family)
MTIDLSGKVAIVTGAGAGLGRSHAIALAQRGAKLIVNDLERSAAEEVCALIEQKGGQAIVSVADVSDYAQVRQMVKTALECWSRIDILVNNAGVLRDRTFAKMEIEVNLMGTVNCTKAVWTCMHEQSYGRIIFTTSSSGLYGNFGQANYGAAKMALVGLMQTLALEGERSNIRVNCLAPSAATAMTKGLYPSNALDGLGPDLVSPAVVALAGPDAPTKRIILAGAGSFEEAHVTMTRGIYMGTDADAADRIFHELELDGREGELVPQNGGYQYKYEVERALARNPVIRNVEIRSP